jgi:predicted outer membrane repeat protein
MRAINGRLMVGAFLVCMLGWVIPAESAILTVDPQGSGFQTIQQAIDAAANGDTVQLVDGTYAGPGNVNLDLRVKTITLCSVSGPANCTVDCAGPRTYFVDGPRGIIKGLTVLNSPQISIYTDDFTLEDCVFKGPWNQCLLDIYHCRPTIVNCTFRDRSGDDGGVASCRGASPTIRGCTFENNSARLDGGAIHNRDASSPVITGCRFVNNSCKEDGGAIANYDASHPVIIDCTFEGNHANDNGGAIFSRSGSCPRIVSCTFAGNRSRANGGAIYGRENAAAIVNCVFTGNSAYNYGGAIYCEQMDRRLMLLNCTLVGNSAGLEGGVLYVEDDRAPSLLNCILWANRDETGDGETNQIFATQPIFRHCCVQNWTGQWGGVANSGYEPQFVDADGPDNLAGTADDNLRLSPGSPCIDAGFDAPLSDAFLTDRDGYPRLMGKVVDMGAYEYALPSELAAVTPSYPQLEEDVIIINEARTQSPDGAKDWVELHNVTDRKINVGGWVLCNARQGTYQIASGTVIEPHGFLVLYQDQHFGNFADPGCAFPFGLNRSGETMYLWSGYGGLFTGLRQEQALEPFMIVGASETLGRHTNSNGTVDFVRLSTPTPGADNADPWVGPVVVTEMVRQKDAFGAPWAYVELCNSSDSPVQVRVQIPIYLDSSVTVPAKARVLITDRPDLVQSVYGSVLPPGVEILRGTIFLGTSFGYGYPLTLGQGTVTYDRVCFRHDWLGLDSWPTTATGELLAVARIDLTRYGNDPNNWQAAAPSPGK